MLRPAVLLCVFTMTYYLAAAQINNEEKTIWEPPPIDVSGKVTDKTGKPLKDVLVHTVFNGRRDSVWTDAVGKFLLKKQSPEAYLHFVREGYDSLETWIAGNPYHEISLVQSASRTQLKADKEALRLNKERMLAFKWKDLLSSHDSVNYRLEPEHTGVLLEFGVDEQAKPFARLLLRFAYTGTASSMPKFLGKDIRLTAEEARLLLAKAVAEKLDKLGWVNAVTHKATGSLVYEGQFEFAGKDRYMLMVRPAAGATKKADQETIRHLQHFSAWFKKEIFTRYEAKVKEMTEELKGFSHRFLPDWGG